MGSCRYRCAIAVGIALAAPSTTRHKSRLASSFAQACSSRSLSVQAGAPARRRLRDYVRLDRSVVARRVASRRVRALGSRHCTSCGVPPPPASPVMTYDLGETSAFQDVQRAGLNTATRVYLPPAQTVDVVGDSRPGDADEMKPARMSAPNTRRKGRGRVESTTIVSTHRCR